MIRTIGRNARRYALAAFAAGSLAFGCQVDSPEPTIEHIPLPHLQEGDDMRRIEYDGTYFQVYDASDGKTYTYSRDGTLVAVAVGYPPLAGE